MRVLGVKKCNLISLNMLEYGENYEEIILYTVVLEKINTFISLIAVVIL